MGYVGLIQSIGLAEIGFEVVGVEIGNSINRCLKIAFGKTKNLRENY